MENNKLHYAYNFFYICLILLSVIVVLLTVKWGAIPDLVKLISFGLTLTSLFLALIAIIYSMFSNSSFSKHIGTLQEASNIVRNSTAKLEDITTNLETKFDQLPKAIQNLETRFEESHKQVLSKIGEKSHQAASKTNEPKEISEDVIKEFLKASSLSGLLILYACELAIQKKSAFNLRDLAGQVDFVNFDYLYGFLVACFAAGYLDYTNKDDVFTISKLHSKMPSLEQVCINRTESLFKTDNTTPEEISLHIKETIGAIKAYFDDV